MALSKKNSKSSAPIIVVGSGLSGLSAALTLEAHGESCLIVESAPHLGGKVESTVVEDRYILDRGFQVLLPSYPELRRLGNLDYELDLHYFAAGAQLETESGSVRIGNPFQEPLNLVSTATGSYGTLRDKLLILKLQGECFLSGASEALLKRAPGLTTKAFLIQYGFSEAMLANFFEPFFSGIFLERNLQTSAGFFLYLFRMFASSPVAVPKRGMGDLPRLMARRLARSEIRLNSPVKNFSEHKIEFESGVTLEARAVLRETAGVATGPFGSVTSLWFAAPEPPFEGPWLSLCSRKKRMSINHVAVLSNVCREYASRGDALICVNVVEATVNIAKVLEEATLLFGASVQSWRLLRRDNLTRPLPLYLERQDPDTPSQQGALWRGRHAAETLLRQL